MARRAARAARAAESMAGAVLSGSPQPTSWSKAVDTTSDALDREEDERDDSEPDSPEAAMDGDDDNGPNYSNQTSRMEALIQFVMLYSPIPAQDDDGDMSQRVSDPVNDIDDADVTSARNLALICCFKAIGRMANRT